MSNFSDVKKPVKATTRFTALIDLRFCAVPSRKPALSSGSTAVSQKGNQPVDQQTKAALKHDQFVDTTKHGLEWANENRHSVIVTGSIILALILVLVGGGLFYNSRSQQPPWPLATPCRPTRRRSPSPVSPPRPASRPSPPPPTAPRPPTLSSWRRQQVQHHPRRQHRPLLRRTYLHRGR